MLLMRADLNFLAESICSSFSATPDEREQQQSVEFIFLRSSFHRTESVSDTTRHSRRRVGRRDLNPTLIVLVYFCLISVIKHTFQVYTSCLPEYKDRLWPLRSSSVWSLSSTHNKVHAAFQLAAVTRCVTVATTQKLQTEVTEELIWDLPEWFFSIRTSDPGP